MEWHGGWYTRGTPPPQPRPQPPQPRPPPPCEGSAKIIRENFSQQNGFTDADQLELTLNADGMLAKMVIKCKAEAATLDAYSGAAPQTKSMQAGGCIDDALWGQDKDAGQLELTLNADGMLAKMVIECKAEAATLDAYSGAAPQTDIMQAGSWISDALCGQCKDADQLELTLHVEGMLVMMVIECKVEAATFDADGHHAGHRLPKRCLAGAVQGCGPA